MRKEKLTEYKKEFEQSLGQIGIHEGSVVYIGSDASKILLDASKGLELRGKDEQFEFLGELIESIQNVVTDKGTLLFPVYSWEFCKGKRFDYKKTQGQVGFLMKSFFCGFDLSVNALPGIPLMTF